MHTINEAAKLIGETYSRVWHAYAYGRVPAPLRVGKAFVLTDVDIERLRAYFESGQRGNPSEARSLAGSKVDDQRPIQRDRHDVASCT
jgi:hypothetical protein